MPMMPSLPRRSTTSRGKRSSFSHAATCGAISAAANSRTTSRIRFWSSVGSKFTAVGPEGGGAPVPGPAPPGPRPAPAPAAAALARCAGRWRAFGTGNGCGRTSLGRGGPRRRRSSLRPRRRRRTGRGPSPRTAVAIAGRAARPGASALPSPAPPRRRRLRPSRRGSGVSTQPSSRWRNVTRISGSAAFARTSSTIFDRSAAAGSAASVGILSASKRTMRVQETRRRAPSGPSKSMTKRSRSWSSECSRKTNPGRASPQISFRMARCFSPPSKVCSIETTRSRNIRVWPLEFRRDAQRRLRLLPLPAGEGRGEGSSHASAHPIASPLSRNTSRAMISRWISLVPS